MGEHEADEVHDRSQENDDSEHVERSSDFNLSMASPPILSVALPSNTGRVLSIQSHAVHGYVGNKSAVFPLQLLGYDVDPINSVQFSNHTGYPTFKGQVLDGQQLWDLVEGLAANNLLYYTHLLTGYIGSVSFLNMVLQVVEKLRLKNPELVYVCDPVMGDEGKLYVPEELVSIYREKVVHVASMLTPNQFEIEQLTGSRIVSEKDALKACNKLHAAGTSKVVHVASMLTPNQFEIEQLTGSRIVSEKDALKACNKLHAAGTSKVIVTSICIDDKFMLIGSHQKAKGQPPEQFKIVIPMIPAYFTGTGDLMTALLLGWSNKYPDDLGKASELAVSSLQAVLQRTIADYEKVGFDIKEGSLEIRLIQSQDDVRDPQVKYKIEKY
ncbi:hypothetical protein HPP92_024102 [Vanilla planifolia]|uniref:Pyridoxal kinase n=1 Tax=Vanilla planifolia TaxID=51239 RepID=A0A835UB85_VANPL|nr:hypothetical protein HPP92_024102 [Vanilla planifolia]